MKVYIVVIGALLICGMFVQAVPGADPCSEDISCHYSWDFAQNVHYPHHSQQVGPIYFATPRTCHVFGICAEGSGKQTFYLADEGELPGKGANSVISMVHHYFRHYGVGERHAEIHFDNAVGQNKNHAVLWYSMWRVLTGLHHSINLNMMLAGHTKFSPDWHFGVWKVKWRVCNAETMGEIANTVQASSRSQHNVPHLAADPDSPVIFHDWKVFLEKYFRKLPAITKYHHFMFSADEPGVVSCKGTYDSEVQKFPILRTQPAIRDLPPVTTLPGLDIARQWYLHETIGQFFRSQSAKESVCPKPEQPKSCPKPVQPKSLESKKGIKRKQETYTKM